MTAIIAIDHVAVTVFDLREAVRFYRLALCATVVREFEMDGSVIAIQLRAGGAMLNVHEAGHSHPLVAAKPTPGSVDLCFRWNEPIKTALAHLEKAGISIIEGPVMRHASDGVAGMSVYFRDLDGNLLEFLSTAGEACAADRSSL